MCDMKEAQLATYLNVDMIKLKCTLCTVMRICETHNMCGYVAKN